MVQRPNSIKTRMAEIDTTCKMQLEVQNALLHVCESKIQFNSDLRVFGLVTISVDGKSNDIVIKLSKEWVKDNSTSITPPITNTTFTPIAPAPTSKYKRHSDKVRHETCMYKSVGMCPTLCPDHHRKKSHYRSRTAPEQYHKMCHKTKSRRDSSAPSPIRRSAFITPSQSSSRHAGTLSAPCYLSNPGNQSTRKRIAHSVGKRFQALRQASRQIDNGTTPVSRYQSAQDKSLPRRSIAQCFGITKNKKLTYSAEDKKDQEKGTFACTLQRLLPRPPIRIPDKTSFNKMEFYDSQDSFDFKETSTENHKEENVLNTAVLLTPPPITPLPLLSPLSPEPFNMLSQLTPSPPSQAEPQQQQLPTSHNTHKTPVKVEEVDEHPVKVATNRILITDFHVDSTRDVDVKPSIGSPTSSTVIEDEVSSIMDASMLSMQSSMLKLKSNLISYDEESVFLESNSLTDGLELPSLKSLASIRFKSRRSIGTPNLLLHRADELKENQETPVNHKTPPSSKFTWPKNIFKSITSTKRQNMHLGLVTNGGVTKRKYRQSPASKNLVRVKRRGRTALNAFISDV